MARDYARSSNRRPSRGHYEAEGGRNWRWPLAGILIVLFAIGIFYLKQQSDKIAAEQGDAGSSIIQRTMKQNNQETTSRLPLANKQSPVANTGKPQPAAQPAPAPQPKFDFYTMLPKGQNAATTTKTTPPPPAVTAQPPVTKPAAPVVKAPVYHQPSTKELEKNAQADTSDLIAAEIEKLNNAKPEKAKAETNSVKTTAHYIVQLGVFKNYSDADQLKAKIVLQGFEVSVKSFKKQSTTLYRVYMGSYPSLAAAKKQQLLLEENQIKSKIARE